MNRVVVRMVGQRVASGALTLFLVSALVFFMASLLPGDAAQMALGQYATPETVAMLRKQLGLDEPLVLRFFTWLGNLVSGDFGVSYAANVPVSSIVLSRIPNTLMLAAAATVASVPVALVLGIVAAMVRGSLLDRVIGVLTMSVVAVPEFLLATLAVLLFAVKLHWVSAVSVNADTSSVGAFLKSYSLPVLVLCCVVVAQMARMTRAALINQLDAPYAEMAVLKGLRPSRTVLRHALPNAVGPIVNAMALSLSYLLGGVIIVEAIFSYPGLASTLVDAVSNRDLPIVQFCVLFFSACYLLLLLVADIVTIVCNPKLR
ncbi:ABC-type dipeptide/oligopeptide/nickel transport system, permease component [Burkholderia sp. Ch1-1]|uniref:ABC-type dipeptide/oligopeptide/nickel transport system, permease component n=1 Tax=Paraburkholderia dioscoreae TaxID=2604047 RepID=A0A5Q4ZN47_9BURK|nr:MULTISPECIES: ABC transporter permease [Paraburkholderia]EIF34464.1 ABC-type dipeptide/oligopeptide/nickel transport system, permease component [Burkholderia sp. Ch1-1]MDR8395330.1 ABC transporter permease [Paraburkholderia sp. USG1]VVD33406.1 ABC-type dipeptide/oligopeptide/nickel transport system, permease component [Paraburkholderia dioscoreae]